MNINCTINGKKKEYFFAKVRVIIIDESKKAYSTIGKSGIKTYLSIKAN